MSDDDIERAMRSADPARTAIDAPLSYRAEEELSRIVSGTSKSSPGRASRRWIAIPAIAAALVAAIAIAHSLSPGHTGDAAAAAATPPVLVGTSDGPLWADAMKRSISAAAGTEESKRGTTYSGWFLNTDVSSDGKTAASYISPQEVTITWAADLSGRVHIVAGTPLAAANGIKTDDAKAPKVGSELSDQTFAAGDFGAMFVDLPPVDAEAMKTYLSTAGVTDWSDPVQVLDTVQSLLNEWTLGSGARAALFQVLGHLPSFKSMGEVTDRLGRVGQGYVASSPANSNFEDMVVVDTSSGTILSIEKVYLGGIAEYKNLTAPAVTSYIVWK